MINWYFHTAVIHPALQKLKKNFPLKTFPSADPHEIAERLPVFHALGYIQSVFITGVAFRIS